MRKVNFLTRLTQSVSLVEQELLTLREHLSSPPVFSGVRVTRSLVLYVCFVDRCLSFCTFYFGHCVFCSSSIYGFWLPLWYLQTLLLKLREPWIQMFISSCLVDLCCSSVQFSVWGCVIFSSFCVLCPIVLVSLDCPFLAVLSVRFSLTFISCLHVVCPFVCFLLVIVLSVLLRYTDSDYPFGIFKLFFI